MITLTTIPWLSWYQFMLSTLFLGLPHFFLLANLKFFTVCPNWTSVSWTLESEKSCLVILGSEEILISRHLASLWCLGQKKLLSPFSWPLWIFGSEKKLDSCLLVPFPYWYLDQKKVAVSDYWPLWGHGSSFLAPSDIKIVVSCLLANSVTLVIRRLLFPGPFGYLGQRRFFFIFCLLAHLWYLDQKKVARGNHYFTLLFL